MRSPRPRHPEPGILHLAKHVRPAVALVRDEALEHPNRRRRSVWCVVLGPADQRRHAVERRVLAQEARDLDLGVGPAGEAAQRLEDEIAAENHRAVTLLDAGVPDRDPLWLD